MNNENCSMENNLTNDPVANPNAIVVIDNARFTILSPQLIRLEWAKDGKFIDEPTLVFLNRYLPVPKFDVQYNNNLLVIKTAKLNLFYQKAGGKFTAQNLSIEFMLNRKKVVWFP